jgi:hypothetical protein
MFMESSLFYFVGIAARETVTAVIARLVRATQYSRGRDGIRRGRGVLGRPIKSDDDG